MNRVAVTGLGAICGLGHNVQKIWDNCLAGKSGISKKENVDPKFFPVPIAGFVNNFQIDEKLISERDQPRFDRFIHFALHSSNEAIEQAKLLSANYNSNRIGVILGTGLGGFPAIEETYKVYLERGARRVSPFFVPSMIPNMASGLISMHWDFHGSNYTTASACASAGHAIASAATEIMLGKQDAMITGGSEAVVSAFTISGFNSMKALSKSTDEPTKASRPFDKDRNGFVMGEGAGILVLENYDKAVARGATILAEIIGTGASADAHHITAPHPEGLGAVNAMKQAISMANINSSQIDYINAHGTSTPVGDGIESGAIKKVFGDHAYKLNVSSTKSMTGHLLGAASGLESIFCIKAMETSLVPPTINLDQPSEDCDLNYTAHKPQQKEINFALNNSFGFGGTNSTTIFKRIK